MRHYTPQVIYPPGHRVDGDTQFLVHVPPALLSFKMPSPQFFLSILSITANQLVLSSREGLFFLSLIPPSNIPHGNVRTLSQLLHLGAV